MLFKKEIDNFLLYNEGKYCMFSYTIKFEMLSLTEGISKLDQNITAAFRDVISSFLLIPNGIYIT